LNDLGCPIHLKVSLVDGTLDVCGFRIRPYIGLGLRIDVARGEKGEGAGGQLTRCFSAVAELFV